MVSPLYSPAQILLIKAAEDEKTLALDNLPEPLSAFTRSKLSRSSSKLC